MSLDKRSLPKLDIPKKLTGVLGFSITFLLILFLNSCISYKNSIIVREPETTKAVDSLKMIKTTYAVYSLQPKDVLSIYISSFLPQITNFFNDERNTGLYQIQDNGYIYLPILDSVKAEGKTIEDVRKDLRSIVRKYASDAYVSVNLASFNVVVLGEVQDPGIKNIKGDRVTLMEVLAMSGGFLDYSNLKKVKVIRKIGNEVKISILDITNETIVLSKYYYLLPGDVVYVYPMKEKTLVFNLRQVSIVTGIFAVANFVFFLFARF